VPSAPQTAMARRPRGFGQRQGLFGRILLIINDLDLAPDQVSKMKLKNLGLGCLLLMVPFSARVTRKAGWGKGGDSAPLL